MRLGKLIELDGEVDYEEFHFDHIKCLVLADANCMTVFASQQKNIPIVDYEAITAIIVIYRQTIEETNRHFS
jgi:hypothetical protein